MGYNATGTVTGGWVALLAGKIAAAFPTAGVTRYDPANYATTSDAAIPGWTSTSVQAQGVGATVNVINAGVVADTTLRCLRRMANFTTAWSPQPDLYLVSLGLGEMTSDTTREATPADYAAGLTGLCNLLRANGAEVALLTPHAGPAPYLRSYAFDDYAQACRGVAAATACALVDVRQLWLDQYASGAANDGYGTWLNTSGGDHANPTDAGHAAIAAELARLFDLSSELPVLGPAGVGRELERVRLLNTSPTILTFTGTWAATANANFASGREYASSTAGNTVTFSARFTDLYMLAGRWHDAGQVTVTIDAASWGTVDLYRANPPSTVDLADYHGAIVPQDRIYLAGPLPDAVHSVTLTLASTKNQGSSGTTWRFDAIELVRMRQAGNILETVVPLQRIMTGAVNVSLSSAASATATLTFPQTFPNGAPQIVATADYAGSLYLCSVNAVSATGATVTVFTRDASTQTATITVHWIAVG